MTVAKSLLVIAVAVLFSVLFNATLGEAESLYFASALGAAQITETVSIHGTPYLVTNGAVFAGDHNVIGHVALKARILAYAKAVAESNPLLALPGTDVNNLSNNASLLTKLEKDLASVNASNTKAAFFSSLYPNETLAAVSNLERTRQQFITTGSDTDEKAYENAEVKAFTQYQSDASTFKKAFAKVVPEGSAKFATDGDILSRTDILNAVDTLASRISGTEELFKERSHCLAGQLRACAPSDLHVPDVLVLPKAPLSISQLKQANEVRSLYAAAHKQPGITDGPLYELSSSACTAHMGGGAPLFAFYNPASSTFSGPYPVYVGNIRFNTTRASTSQELLQFDAAMKRHVTYVLDSPMLHYSCTELATDAGKLFTMHDVYAYAQQHLVSNYATSSEARATLALLEQPVGILTEHDVAAYLATAETLLLPRDAKNSVRELSLAYQNNSSRFDASVGELLGDEETNIALVKFGWPIALDVQYVFFVRNSFPMLMLADNRSATGGNLALFPPNYIDPSKQPFVYYSNLPHTQAMLQKLANDIYFFYIIHVDPSIALH